MKIAIFCVKERKTLHILDSLRINKIKMGIFLFLFFVLILFFFVFWLSRMICAYIPSRKRVWALLFWWIQKKKMKTENPGFIYLYIYIFCLIHSFSFELSEASNLMLLISDFRFNNKIQNSRWNNGNTCLIIIFHYFIPCIFPLLYKYFPYQNLSSTFLSNSVRNECTCKIQIVRK